MLGGVAFRLIPSRDEHGESLEWGEEIWFTIPGITRSKASSWQSREHIESHNRLSLGGAELNYKQTSDILIGRILFLHARSRGASNLTLPSETCWVSAC